jgi:hypothetical protein
MAYVPLQQAMQSYLGTNTSSGSSTPPSGSNGPTISGGYTPIAQAMQSYLSTDTGQAQRPIATQRPIQSQPIQAKPQGFNIGSFLGNAEKTISGFLPQTVNDIKQLALDPLNIKADPRKALTDYVNGIKDSIFQSADSIRKVFTNDTNTPPTTSERVGSGLKAIPETVGAILSPVTSLFSAAKDIPGMGGNFARLLNVAFGALGEGGSAIGTQVVDHLPISPKIKNDIKPGIQQIFALAAQFAVGGKAAHDLTPAERGALINKYGLEDAITIETKAKQLALNTPPDAMPQHGSSSDTKSPSINVIDQTGDHTMMPLNNLVSVKDEPPASIDKAKEFMQQAENGQGKSREPLSTIPLQDGKHLITDGNATYHALQDQGYTHAPVKQIDMSKLDGIKITDEQIKQAAQDHFTADSRKKVYGQLFQEIAHKFGLEKVGTPNVADVKSIPGILEKRHGRNLEVKDALRDTIIIKKPEDAAKIVAELRSRGFNGNEFNSERRLAGYKDRYTGETHGYRDANYQFTGPDGQTVELQMMQRHMHTEKELLGHPVYDLVDKAGLKIKNPSPELQHALEVWKKYADDRYQAAFLKDNPDLANVTSDRTSSSVTGLPDSSPDFINSLKEQLKTLRQAPSASVTSAADKLGTAFNSVIGDSSRNSVAENGVKSNDKVTENTPQTERTFDAKGKEVITKAPRKVLTGNEVRAIRDVMESKLQMVRENSKSPQDFSKGIDNLVKDITQRAQGDKQVLSALRTELNKEMYGVAGASTEGNYKEAYRTLQHIKETDPEMGAVVSKLEDHIQAVDEKLLAPREEKPQYAFQKDNQPKEKATANTAQAPQNPVGEGKLRNSRAFERLVEHLQATDPEAAKALDETQVKYNRANFEKQAEKALAVIEKNPDQAYRIAKGIEKPPDGVLQRAVNLALSDRALQEKNYGMVADLEASGSLAQTRRGQEIAYDRGRFNENSPHAFIQEVMSRRLARIGNITDTIKQGADATKEAFSSAKARAVAKIDKVTDTLSKELKQRQVKIQSAQSLLDQLTCK